MQNKLTTAKKLKSFSKYMQRKILKAGKLTPDKVRYGLDNVQGNMREKIAKTLLSNDQYIKYKGLNIACRMTVAVYDIRTIKLTAKYLKECSKELSRIAKQTQTDTFKRVVKAQQEIMRTNATLKAHTNVIESFGIHGLK